MWTVTPTLGKQEGINKMTIPEKYLKIHLFFLLSGMNFATFVDVLISAKISVKTFKLSHSSYSLRGGDDPLWKEGWPHKK